MTKILLDPGHNVATAGKRSPDSSLMEWEFNQSIVDRTMDILNNANVFRTKNDTFDAYELKKDLAIRGVAIEKVKPDFFISIHANAHGNGSEWTSASGFEVLSPNSPSSLSLANSFLSFSSTLLSNFNIKNRGLKINDSLYVFKKCLGDNIPCILVEYGFFTNKEECEKLKNKIFREAASQELARFISALLNENPVEQNTSESNNEKYYIEYKGKKVLGKLEDNKFVVEAKGILNLLDIPYKWDNQAKAIIIE